MNSTSANYKINAILSKVINRSALPLKETAMGETLKHPGQTIASQQPVVKQNDSTSGSNAPDQIISEKKKMLELKILKKTKVFEGGDPNSKTKIRIGVAFSVLNIDN
jgi:hypothetical protein